MPKKPITSTPQDKADALTLAASAMGRLGGSSGTGDAKRRSAEHYSEAGKKGAATRAKNLTNEQRQEIAKKAAKARWRKNQPGN